MINLGKFPKEDFCFRFKGREELDDQLRQLYAIGIKWYGYSPYNPPNHTAMIVCRRKKDRDGITKWVLSYSGFYEFSGKPQEIDFNSLNGSSDEEFE